MTDIRQLPWFKSSYSGGSGTECLECALTDTMIRIRDSKYKNGSVLDLRPRTWTCFVQAVSRADGKSPTGW
ncbi:DUF397 domain-containing protein [Streptomyces griseoviridis]|uniref:DUF397 domain-containing protein n=1 Tax=Streptomyces griseoviridis TaxID=45398 RepID=UPI00167729F6|nr:DUF397 domain-containing protein [Streptomyces griseoviridis]